MGELGDSWREHRDHKKRVAKYHEIACVHCGRKQNWEASRCIRCGRIDWYTHEVTPEQQDKIISEWLNSDE